MDDIMEELWEDLTDGDEDASQYVSPTLFKKTSKIFRDAIAEGFSKSSNNSIDTDKEFAKAFTHSADVYSLFRSHRESQVMAGLMHDEDNRLKTFEQWKKDVSQYVNPRWNEAWLRTEYDTAALRAQQAADWKVYEADADILPNLRWMPTSSVTPREEHRVFWASQLTLPVDDKFWNKHRPGDSWNCKCYLIQTSAPATDKSTLPPEKELPEAKPGLSGNPAKTEELFSQDHPFFPKKCSVCPFHKGKVKNIMNASDTPLCASGDCPYKDGCESVLVNMKDVSKSQSKKVDESKVVPPHVEEYTHIGGNVYESSFHGDAERDGNEKMAEKLAIYFNKNVYLLPRLNPETKEGKKYRNDYMPEGVKEGKSPDYMIDGIIYEGKSMLSIVAKTKQELKKSIENHFRKAKEQADNVVLEISESYDFKYICNTITNKLKCSHCNHIVILIYGDKVYEFRTK